jgi:hypothetical protein
MCNGLVDPGTYCVAAICDKDLRGIGTTKLQSAAYGAQFGAALPISDLGAATFATSTAPIAPAACAAYLHAIQSSAWFEAAFTGHRGPVTVVGGGGRSHADRDLRRVKIGSWDRSDAGRTEHACLHELAHIVTRDYSAAGSRREPAAGVGTSRGHHHAWRANFVFIVSMALGREAAVRLRHEFTAWGLPTVSQPARH